MLTAKEARAMTTDKKRRNLIMRIKKTDVTELINDINAIIADIYGVSQSISKNVDVIARELIKLGYKKESK